MVYEFLRKMAMVITYVYNTYNTIYTYIYKYVFSVTPINRDGLLVRFARSDSLIRKYHLIWYETPHKWKKYLHSISIQTFINDRIIQYNSYAWAKLIIVTIKFGSQWNCHYIYPTRAIMFLPKESKRSNLLKCFLSVQTVIKSNPP